MTQRRVESFPLGRRGVPPRIFLPAIAEASETAETEKASSRSDVGALGWSSSGPREWWSADGSPGWAGRLASTLGLSQSAVGLTLVSLATTAELHALVVTADRRGIEELALAGVLGSALYIATTTLGHAAVMHPLGSVNVTWRAFFAAVLSLLLIFYVLVQGGVAQFVVGYGACLAGTLR